MMRRAFHWIMIGTLVLLGFGALIIFGELFRAYLGLFIFLWFFTPVVAIWLNTQPVLAALSVSQVKVARSFLVGTAIAISFAAFAHYDRIRDSIGYEFIDGYVVSYYQDTDDYGRAYRASNVSTAHWYSGFGLWAFGWLFFGACVVVPFVTWYAAGKAVDKAIRQSANNDDAA